jgi:6-phosphogluconate dehydrogenase
MSQQHFGLIGMDVMGQSLALNVASKGFSVAVFNRTGEKTKKFIEERCQGKTIVGTYELKDFAAALERPRRILLMVKAGEPVDSFISMLKPLLEKGDVIIDGGNSFYKDTQRRCDDLEKAGLYFIGTGVSGGEYGALVGPSIMPGGARPAYDRVESIFLRIAAKTEDGPCCAYMGPGGAGHYVKMVHNGIEYGIMQLLAETYDFMSQALKMKAPEMKEVFAKWNEGEHGGYLVEITRDVLGVTDEETKKPLVDLILDTAGQKGTGKWTTQDSLDVGYPIPTIDAALEARIVSAYKKERVQAAKVLKGPRRAFVRDRTGLVAALGDALLGSMITSYAQGMGMLRAASAEYNYSLDLPEIARVWKGGCIIRAKLLNPIRQAYLDKADLVNLMLAPYFAQKLASLQDNWRLAVGTAVRLGIPCLAMGASLAYYDSYRRARLPANLTQAQRDYFGAHTYQRTDKEGTFHTDWLRVI